MPSMAGVYNMIFLIWQIANISPEIFFYFSQLALDITEWEKWPVP